METSLTYGFGSDNAYNFFYGKSLPSMINNNNKIMIKYSKTKQYYSFIDKEVVEVKFDRVLKRELYADVNIFSYSKDYLKHEIVLFKENIFESYASAKLKLETDNHLNYLEDKIDCKLPTSMTQSNLMTCDEYENICCNKVPWYKRMFK